MYLVVFTYERYPTYHMRPLKNETLRQENIFEEKKEREEREPSARGVLSSGNVIFSVIFLGRRGLWKNSIRSV